jgi:hypothetical protein
VDDTITWLKSIYGEDMRVSRGKKHDYLGMDLDYSVQGEVKVTMIDYLKRVITEFPEEITGTASSPAAERLFTVTMRACHWRKNERLPSLRSTVALRETRGK